MLIPASHKTNLPHPGADQSTGTHKQGQGLAVDGHPGAIEVFMKAGDALLFTDAIAHGSARRVNEGFRRICVMRYMPSWANFRMPYEPTQELLARLTPQRRQVVAPLWANKLAREPQRKEDEEEELLLQEQLDDSGTKNPILPNGRINGWV
jgi:ectoine hydroxylase-related dioxygenase (phytanoyl-CoA dioxygenase family)